MYSLITYSHTILLVTLTIGNFNVTSVYGYIFCHCDTDECRAFGYKECKAEFYCYSIYELNWPPDKNAQLLNRSTDITGTSISRGCISNSFLTMCTKKEIRSKKQLNSPYLITHCCRDAWCNADKVKIAQSDWLPQEPKRFIPKTADYSKYEGETKKPASLRQNAQFKSAPSLITSRNFENFKSGDQLIRDDYSESLLNSGVISQGPKKQITTKEEKSEINHPKRGIRQKTEKGVENIEAESNHVLTENFHLSYFNPLKSTPSKSYSMNTLLAQPIYVAMGIALSILLFGILFLTTALLIYRKHKHFHISNCHAVCNYSCHNGNAVTSPTMESVNHKSSVGISENLNRYQNLSQLTTMYPNQNSVDQPLLLNGISSNESMNPSTEYRSLPSGHGDNNWLKPVDNVTSHEKKENICKENLFTYCCCCYPYRDNVVPTNHIHDNNTTSKRFTSFRNSSMLNKRTPVSIDSNNNSNISGEHFHPAICEESELSLNTENQKHDPSSVSTPLFSLHSASLHQISDLIEHRKLNSNNHSNNNKPLLYNNQNTFTWIQNQQSQLHQQSRHQKFQQLNSNLVGNQEDQQQTHSMINELNGNNSNSSCLNEINNKGSPDYELIKTTTNYKSNENELDWTVDAINSFSHRKNDTDSQNVDTNWKCNNSNDLCSPEVYDIAGINTECDGSHQDSRFIQQQTLAPIHLSDLTFPHLPPPPSYPPPPQQHQQQPQQFIEALNSSNQIIQNKTSPFVELHRLDMLLQRQRGTGKTSSGGEDSKTIESEQSELNHTWKLSGSRESSSGASTAILGQRSILNNNNNNRNNSRFLEYSPDFNKLTGRKVTERDFIGLATFRKADEKHTDLVTPYAEFDLSPDSSVYNS